MNYLNSFPKLKMTLVVSTLAVFIIGFSSCEKADDVEPTTASKVNLVTKSEVVVVEKDEWFYSSTNQETTLETTLLPHRGGYGCVEVFIKNENSDSKDGVWESLPNQSTQFQIRDGCICILKPIKWVPVRSSYLVKVQLRSTITDACEKADLSPKAIFIN